MDKLSADAMKKPIAFLSLIVFSIVFASGVVLAENWVNVRWVDDGDTVVLTDGRRVRYIGINAPEIKHEYQKAEPYGYEAKEFNKKLVFSRTVRLEFDEERYDQYGRLLAYVFLKEGLFVNKEMVEKGYAHCLFRIPNIRYNEALLPSQQEAMTARKGIWSHWEEKKGLYIGNKTSLRFHLELCTFASSIGKKHRIVFSKMWDAYWRGFSPCKTCIVENNRKP